MIDFHKIYTTTPIDLVVIFILFLNKYFRSGIKLITQRKFCIQLIFSWDNDKLYSQEFSLKFASNIKRLN